MADFNENVVANEEVAVVENENPVEEVYDPATDTWTRKEKIGTGLVLGTSLVGTAFIGYEVVKHVAKPVVEGVKKAGKAVKNGFMKFFGKKTDEEPAEEPEEVVEEKPKPKKKASKKKVEPTEK
ncbi:MAG: hypothetical protein J6U54_07710 [Clostridiales bacterium]|nr:hypothetical protein [Clostridiales bacterium]